MFEHNRASSVSQGEPDCMAFIQGLDWLQPNSSSVNVESVYQPHIPVHLKSDKASIWLYRSLENHSLSQKLSWLISDREHLLTCYEPTAFLCQENYCEATIICLRALEQYQPGLLSEINPTLLLTNFEIKDRSHRRSSSFPSVGSNHEWVKKSNDSSEENMVEKEAKKIKENISFLLRDLNIKDNVDGKDHAYEEKPKLKNVGKLKPWSSLNDLKYDVNQKNIRFRKRSATISLKFSQTMPNTPMHKNVSFMSSREQKLSPSVLSVDYTKIALDNSKIMTPKKIIYDNDSIYVENESIITTSSPQKGTDLKSSDSITPIKKLTKAGQIILGSGSDYSFMPLTVQAGKKDINRCPKKSFIEDGGSSITPMATGYFPRPVQGQSLTSFLSSGQFSHTSAELDRENAHFSISEAMIAAIEQVKFNNRMRIEVEQTEESEDEMHHLQQRIRFRRKHKLKKKVHRVISDDDDESTITPRSTPPDSQDDTLSTDGGIDDFEIDSASNLAHSHSVSVSLASLYSGSDVLKRPREAPDGQSDCVLSAEGVALSLISKFKPKQLPKASELQWLVSELEVPQQLLPLPTSWPISPDASVSSSPDHITPLRGTVDWAPPRPQIIFTLHPVPIRRELMDKQNYRCAGCGMRVAVQYASRFRYCDYLGRYFCTGCHSNQLALIPGRILHKWDFNRYPVSNFSYRLLDQMSVDPLFNIGDINPGLYRKNRQLEKCRDLRLQLYFLKSFVLTCRFAVTIQNILKTENSYIYAEPELYSINDLCSIKKGDMVMRLKERVETALLHVNTCDLCKARGFVCEVCLSGDIIFPWQLQKVSQCPTCGACYHKKKCWTYDPCGVPCKRCVRLKQRRESRQEATIVN
ncbi:run domain Beclin-1-interacting and cysteine-rich domain-containing protein isoform X2 [Chrysoperla carnea]|uniref:run domain Beclin-1-interacting and cysteine-rich domain-containing protein isoform X2 n=1 Tax=Chrysoperla carnea TaxID=189513 RepID=UPI001D07AB3B|nr:run domain Beclin-1-interacting and cysteine-rich domain-containing protein isoform X2 [Chrysoperla carnea]